MAFNPEAARGVNQTFQFDLSGENGGTWTVKIANGTCEVTEGTLDTPPDNRMETDADTYVAMSAGEIAGDEAFLLGRLGSEGIFGGGLIFDTFFTATPAGVSA